MRLCVSKEIEAEYNSKESKMKSFCSPLLSIAEAGEIAGPGAQVVQAGVLLGGAGPGAGP